MTTQLYSNTASTKILPGVILNPVSKRFILLAENDDANYFYFEVVTRKLNIRLIRATDGIQAVEAVKSNPDISLVLLNLWLPKMSGYEATKHINMINPKLPVIALSSIDFPDYQRLAIESGFSDYISKPVNPGDFRDLIRKWITTTK